MKLTLSIFLVLISIRISAQSSILFEGKGLRTDQFGYYYEIFDNEIKKYTTNDGNLNYTYSNNVLGVIANVDVTNPYKILIYFNDFTKIIILDNTLSPTSELIDLSETDIDVTSLVCKSYNNGIWYYNYTSFELLRLNQNLETVNRSGNLATLLNNNLQPNFLIEYNNKLYLNDPKNGILVFDIYGTYLKTIPIYGLDEFQVKDKYLIYVNEKNQIELYDFFTLETRQYKPDTYNQVELVRVENSIIFIVNKNHQLILDKIIN